MQQRREHRLILFDWSGVVTNEYHGVDTRNDAFLRVLARCGVVNPPSTDAEVQHVLDQVSDLTGIDLRTSNRPEDCRRWIAALGKVLNTRIPYVLYYRIYQEETKKISWNHELAEYIYGLKPRVNIGILSNRTLLDYPILLDQIGISMFDYVFLSFMMGLKKPDMAVYEEVNRAVSQNHISRILFFDDKEKNTKVAEQYGWETCTTKGLDTQKIIDRCEEFIEED